MGRFTRRFPLLSPSFLLRRKAVTQGFFGDSRVWQLIGVIIFGRRILRKIFGSDPETVAVERLEPGHTITLTAIRRNR